MKSHHSFLQLNRSGATLVELMAMLLIVSLALTTLFYALAQSITFARDTEARVRAIALAREGIEAIYNIRNTNWLRYSSDRKHCWNALNYTRKCIGDVNLNGNKIKKGSYLLFQEHGLWKLKNEDNRGNWDSGDFHNSAEIFQVGVTGFGWYSASGGYDKNVFCNNINSTNCRSMFSREILVENVLNDDGSGIITEDKPATSMQVRSSVYWYSGGPKKVELVADITNWKARYDENK